MYAVILSSMHFLSTVGREVPDCWKQAGDVTPLLVMDKATEECPTAESGMLIQKPDNSKVNSFFMLFCFIEEGSHAKASSRSPVASSTDEGHANPARRYLNRHTEEYQYQWNGRGIDHRLISSRDQAAALSAA